MTFSTFIGFLCLSAAKTIAANLSFCKFMSFLQYRSQGHHNVSTIVLQGQLHRRLATITITTCFLKALSNIVSFFGVCTAISDSYLLDPFPNTTGVCSLLQSSEGTFSYLSCFSFPQLKRDYFSDGLFSTPKKVNPVLKCTSTADDERYYRMIASYG